MSASIEDLIDRVEKETAQEVVALASITVLLTEKGMLVLTGVESPKREDIENYALYASALDPLYNALDAMAKVGEELISASVGKNYYSSEHDSLPLNEALRKAAAQNRASAPPRTHSI